MKSKKPERQALDIYQALKDRDKVEIYQWQGSTLDVPAWSPDIYVVDPTSKTSDLIIGSARGQLGDWFVKADGRIFVIPKETAQDAFREISRLSCGTVKLYDEVKEVLAFAESESKIIEDPAFKALCLVLQNKL